MEAIFLESNLELLNVDLPYFTHFKFKFKLVKIQMFCISHGPYYVLHSIDICTVPIKNVRNMEAVSVNQSLDILNFNDKVQAFKVQDFEQALIYSNC